MQDDKLKELLEMYRTAGRKVFLATNSLWAYTHVVMNFLIEGHEGRDKTTDWLKVHPCLADLVCVRRLLFGSQPHASSAAAFCATLCPPNQNEQSALH